jgi:autotransporter-associated beta strand protein
MKFCNRLFAALVVFAVSLSTAQAQLYWDTNASNSGATPGGSGDATGTWDNVTSNWNPVVDGTGATQAWVPNSAAVFSAGSDATGTFTVTIDDNVAASGITFEDTFEMTIGANPAGQLTLVEPSAGVQPNIAVVDSGIYQINAPIGGTSGYRLLGGGDLRLGGASTYTGNTTVTPGNEIILAAANVIPDASVLVLLNGSAGTAFRLNGFNETVKSVSNGGSTGIQPVIFLGTNTLTLADPQGEIMGAFPNSVGVANDFSSPHGTIVKNGSGSFTINGATGQFAGGEFILNEGNVTIGNNNVFGTNANGSKLTMNGGSLTVSVNMSMNTENLDIGGDFAVNMNTNGNFQFFGNGNGPTVLKTSPTITVNPDPTRPVVPAPNNPTNIGGAFILGGIIQDDGATPRSITKTGDGLLVIANPANSYSGDTTIQQGLLRLSKQVGAESAVGDGKAGTGRINLSGGTFTFNGGFSATSDTQRQTVVGSPVRVTANSEMTYMTTTANLVPITPGTLTDFHNIYAIFTSNQIDRTGGTLTIRNDGVCTSNGNVCTFRPTFTGNFNYDGPIVVSNQIDDATTGRLSTRGTVLQSANTTLTQTWSGDISGTGGLRRTGAGGTTVLTGANTYAGGTTVDGGTLTASGSSATFGDGDIMVSGGVLGIASGVLDAIDDAAALTVTTGGMVSLGVGINDILAGLTLDSFVAAPGTYGHSTSSATNSGLANPDTYFQAGAGILTIVAQGLPGDYNEDQVVDAADYVMWRKLSPNPTGPALPNDDSPGVNTDDYDRWVEQFGESSAGSGGNNTTGQVPEPTGAVLVVAVLLAAGATRRRQL